MNEAELMRALARRDGYDAPEPSEPPEMTAEERQRAILELAARRNRILLARDRGELLP